MPVTGFSEIHIQVNQKDEVTNPMKCTDPMKCLTGETDEQPVSRLYT